MRIKITGGGIYNSKGEEIPIGTELDVKKEPTGWAGRYETIGGNGKDAVNNEPEADIEKMKVDELKAFLTANGVEIPADAKKDDLLALARKVEPKA